MLVDAEEGVGKAGDAIGSKQPPRAERERYDTVTGQIDEAAGLVSTARIAVVDRRDRAVRRPGRPAGRRPAEALQKLEDDLQHPPVAARGDAGEEVFAVALGILTAIGGFVDIGDLVTNAQVGARFGLSLGWVVVLGVLGICVFAEMSGRVAAVSGRATFDLVRERLGPRMGMANLLASMAVTLLTFVAEIGGVALALQLVTSVNYVLLVPFVAFVVWLILWRARFSVMENVLGLFGLALIVFARRAVAARPGLGRPAAPDGGRGQARRRAVADLGLLRRRALRRRPDAVRGLLLLLRRRRGALDGQGHRHDAGQRLHRLPARRAALAGHRRRRPRWCSARWTPASTPWARSGCRSRWRSGKIGLAVALVGFVAATLGAACETGLSVGYSIAQYHGWQWGKYVRPDVAARFHLVLALVDDPGRPGCCSRRSTRSWSPSSRWSSPPSRCR